MKPNPEFTNLDKLFWANVRTIGQELGYTQRGEIRTYTLKNLCTAMEKSLLDCSHLIHEDQPTPLAMLLIAYFHYRADILYNFAKFRLMDSIQAQEVFYTHYHQLQPKRPIPMNKQKGDKRKHAFLTGLVNMILEANLGDLPCDYDPRKLTTITKNNIPLRTLARRVDGCFPSSVNPIAIWEIKEYYYTTTFGSRIADGVYETLLDGMELEELREHEQIEVQHILIIDAYHTWWNMGKSYLCRIVDMLHMGYVDEVLFGYEVIERLPELVREWADIYHSRQ